MSPFEKQEYKKGTRQSMKFNDLENLDLCGVAPNLVLAVMQTQIITSNNFF